MYKQPRLEHFNADEFREWWPNMSPRLLILLDVLRFQLRRPVIISPHPNALGRKLGLLMDSEHNVERWGEVLAVDCFVSGAKTKADAILIYKTAKDIGFTGIGVYPEWRLGNGKICVGFHLGVRANRPMGDPAKWGYVLGQYCTLRHAFNSIE